MLPFEFIVEGSPLSQQTKNKTRLRAWRQTLRSAAGRYLPVNAQPSKERLQITVVYYYSGATAKMDNDNMIKPIQDALQGLVYVDDNQITDTRVRRTNLNGAFRVRGMSPVLAEGFCLGTEFLHIKIEEAPDHREIL
jgi:crossover junction endodeoxyribonuclease RusA